MNQSEGEKGTEENMIQKMTGLMLALSLSAAPALGDEHEDVKTVSKGNNDFALAL